LAHNRRTTFHMVTLRALDFPIASQFKRRLIHRPAKSQTCLYYLSAVLPCCRTSYTNLTNSRLLIHEPRPHTNPVHVS